MNTRFRTAAWLFLGLTAVTFAAPASTALADPPKKAFLIAPGEPYGLPKFGFASTTLYGFGERVEYVRPGGRAYYLGLEPGDVILSLNGYKLTYHGAWNEALSRALYDGNYVRLKVRDVRTGNVYFRDTYVNYDGPTNYYKANGPFPNDHEGHDHNFGKTIETIHNVKKLLN